MAETGERSTYAKRSGEKMITFGMGALLFLSFAIGLFANDHPVGGVILSLLTLWAFYATFSGTFTAACPMCGHTMEELSEGKTSRCPSCSGYSVLIKGQLRELGPAATR